MDYGPNADAVIDWEQLKRAIIVRAVAGLNGAALYCEQRAKHHAPVRKIFDARNSPRGPETIRRYSRAPFNKMMMKELKRSSSKRRRVDTKEGPVYAHANSNSPLFTSRVGGRRVNTQGDFRRFNRDTGRLSEGVTGSRTVSGERGYQETRFDPNSQLTSRGRWELKSGRAVHRPTENVYEQRGGKTVRRVATADFAQVGGKLRSGIYTELADPSSTRGIIWARVISPVPYSLYQEVGTLHHRAQPYMRPALYESRQKLVERVRSEVRKVGTRVRKGAG